MPVKIHGKDYWTVAERMKMLKDDHGQNYSLKTKCVEVENTIKCKAKIFLYLEQGKRVFHGSAEEVRGSTQINKTSALENCETSAIGRALSACGYSGGEYASANEVENAIEQQEKGPKIDKKAPKTASEPRKETYASTGQRELLSSLLETKQMPPDKMAALVNLLNTDKFLFNRAEKAIEYMGTLSDVGAK